MIEGRISADGCEAFVFLTVLGGGDREREVEAVIDTGFTEYLTLPADSIRALSLPLRGYGEGILADGSVVKVGIYRARVVWHGKRRGIEVQQSDGGPLIGMGLLQGGSLYIEAAPGGRVVIEEFLRRGSPTQT
ncbi:MAG: clan AA aspartic protease [Actinomycetota bacterium]|jgi:clan AA aspartic protease|nr:clan AA aspartic protease [Actinomycetota bacterium]